MAGKLIRASDTVHERLNEIKREEKHTSLDSVLRELLHLYEKERG